MLSKIKSQVIRLFSSRADKARRYLGLTKESSTLAAELQNPVARRKWAKKVLNVNVREMNFIKEIRNKGLAQFCLESLGLSKEDYLDFSSNFQGKNKVERIRNIIGEGKHHIRDFFNLAYTDFQSYRKKNKSEWKSKGYKNHLLVIQQILNRALIADDLTIEDFRTIAVRSFMAYDCYRNNKTVQLTPNSNVKAKAA